MAPSASSVRAGAGLRVLRTAVFTAVCVTLAAAGHSLASGRPVPLFALPLGWLATFAVVAPLAGRERSMRGIVVMQGVAQIVLHAGFSVAYAYAHPSPPMIFMTDEVRRVPELAAKLGLTGMPEMTTKSDMSMSGGMGGSPPGGGFGWHSLSGRLLFCSPSMVFAHLLAAVATGWLLRRGDIALWGLVTLSARGVAALSPATAFRRVCTLLLVLAARAPYPWPRTSYAPGRATPARHRTVWLLRHSMARRGPPVVILAA